MSAAIARSYGSARMPNRGYAPVYRSGATCPCCLGTQWHIGRSTAQCARCSAALPLNIGGTL